MNNYVFDLATCSNYMSKNTMPYSWGDVIVPRMTMIVCAYSITLPI